MPELLREKYKEKLKALKEKRRQRINLIEEGSDTTEKDQEIKSLEEECQQIRKQLIGELPTRRRKEQEGKELYAQPTETSEAST